MYVDVTMKNQKIAPKPFVDLWFLQSIFAYSLDEISKMQINFGIPILIVWIFSHIFIRIGFANGNAVWTQHSNSVSLLFNGFRLIRQNAWQSSQANKLMKVKEVNTR